MMRGAILSLGFLVSAPALADDDPILRLSGYHFDTAQWYFQPVHNEETGSVTAIIAIAKPDATIGDNLNTIMFIRDGDQFEAWSWRNATRARAVYSAKLLLNVSDDDDALWMLDEELPWLDPNPVRPPTAYHAGMLTDDPLFEPIMDSNDPQALIDMLAEIGYPVAAQRPEGGGGGESTEPCPEVEQRLLAMSHATEWAIVQTLTEESAGDISDGMASWFSCVSTPCTPTATGPVGAATAWVPGACTVTFDNQDIVLATGGATVSCNYKVKKFFTRSRSTPAINSYCAPVTCRQTQIGRAESSISCPTWIPTGTTIPSCPGSPSCASGPHSTCNATAPTILGDWGPPCI